MRVVRTALCVLLLAGAGLAQQLKFPPDLDRLAARANEVVDVNMDRHMLQFASKFLSDKNADDAEAKRLIQNLDGIYVKSFEFDKKGVYSPADVDAFRAQLKSPTWGKIIDARSKADGENVEVYVKLENGAIKGMAIIAAEPMELTLVHIDGPIDPEQLSSLGGQFGIPKVHMGRKSINSKGVRK